MLRQAQHERFKHQQAESIIREDEDASELVLAQFKKADIDVRLGHTAKQFIIENGEKILLAEHEENTIWRYHVWGRGKKVSYTLFSFTGISPHADALCTRTSRVRRKVH